MKGRAFIYGYLFFPRGCASANYVQYLALALKKIGYSEVIVITNGSKELCEFNSKENSYYYKGIRVEFFELHTNKFRHYFEYNFGRGNLYASAIQRYNPTSQDLIIGYCKDCFEIIPIQRLAKRYNFRTAACIPEFFSYKDFKHGYFNYMYWFYKYTLNHTIKKHDYLFPISTYIMDKYKYTKAMCLPIMADPLEYAYKRKAVNKKRKIIYPSYGKSKDLLSNMLIAVSELSDEELSKLEFHITGIKREDIEVLKDKKISMLTTDVIILHQWMEYEDLVKLYLTVDFLLIAREENQMTMANFPSKVPEALCYGVIPIVSRVGDYTRYYLTDGIDSIIFDGSGISECISAIRKALCLENKAIEQLSLNARKCALEKFDYRLWTTRLGDFLAN